MEEYQKHILDNKHFNQTGHKQSICGEDITHGEWVFTDVEHAFNSIPDSRLQPCPKCVEKVIEIFKQARMTEEEDKELTEAIEKYFKETFAPALAELFLKAFADLPKLEPINKKPSGILYYFDSQL